MESHASQSSKNGLGDFDRRFSELAEVMQRSWGENKEQPLLYTPEFLASVYDYPGIDLALSPTLYREGRLAGFIAGLPRPARFSGRPLNLVLNTFLTISTEWKRAGYGPAMWGELSRRGKAAGLDGTISYCVEGDVMNRILTGVAAAMGQKAIPLFDVSYMARILRPPSEAAELSTQVEGPDPAELLLELTDAVGDKDVLVRQWSREEAEWQCRLRLDAVALATQSRSRRGVITGYMMNTGGAQSVTCVLLDDVLVAELDPAEQQQLMASYLQLASARGARLAIAPVLGYVPPEVLSKAGFRKTRKVLHAYYTPWTEAGPTEKLPAMYMDVI